MSLICVCGHYEDQHEPICQNNWEEAGKLYGCGCMLFKLDFDEDDDDI